MQIAVFGSTGEAGRLTVREALARGHDVVASVFRSVLVHRAHRSRHSLSFIRLRRSQVRIVFSGTSKRAASSA